MSETEQTQLLEAMKPDIQAYAIEQVVQYNVMLFMAIYVIIALISIIWVYKSPQKDRLKNAGIGAAIVLFLFMISNFVPWLFFSITGV